MKERRFNSFSVPLGLLDYVNPILYTVTMITVIRNIGYQMAYPLGMYMFIGVLISVFFGFIIPTGKVLVGLGIIRFRMPVSLVFCVNSGILISGLLLFHYVMKLKFIAVVMMFSVIMILLILLYLKNRKMNTIAVLTGAVGYLLIYISLITLSFRKEMIVPVILYGLGIGLFVMLCGIGIRADLKNPKVHWVIEGSNVLCQLFVAIATLILFSR